MDYTALFLSLELAVATMAILLPLAIWAGYRLAYARFRGRSLVEAAAALPLVLPPTVLGYYLLVAMGSASPIGRLWESIFGTQLIFSFQGILVASILVNVPFALQPVQRGFEAIGEDLRDAAASCGMSPWTRFLRVELPLVWPAIGTAAVLVFAHTLGEFGVLLMVGGAIPGSTQTIAIAIYDRVQAFDDRSAAIMSSVLLLLSLVAIGTTFWASRRRIDVRI